MTRRPATEQEAAALASSVRLRIIRLTYEQALTNKEIAARLQRDPATTLHHVRKLVDTGFLRAQPERRGARGAREIPYRSTGLSWQLDGSARDAATAEAVLEAFLAELADVGAASLEQTRLVMRLNEAGRRELSERLQALLDEFTARPPDTDGDLIAMYVATYPGD